MQGSSTKRFPEPNTQDFFFLTDYADFGKLFHLQHSANNRMMRTGEQVFSDDIVRFHCLRYYFSKRQSHVFLTMHCVNNMLLLNESVAFGDGCYKGFGLCIYKYFTN